ncbi:MULTISPECIES: response regulator transcription factor [unclassified Pseudofrankia]|uniref:response regulator transcription factor n=1 Tax=unclassified Pseudofrankia TaxID=2994372 RepID=UPI0008DADEF3|nr:MULTISPECIES: response regulator transcription factor [unclassified Pseudofrankia]MDT3442566.1 response regulator transcription factor [Pseudofrankia sp. BMG5.37]OHV71777.1 DNA-binding response regulator [Pseudofrankia sp. BMG5.36]
MVSPKFSVLVVENASDGTVPLTQRLRRQGYDVEAVDTGSAAIASHVDTDIILLDLELPDLDGLEVCRAIRSESDVPLIAVSSRTGELDHILGLQAGADDYVVKPYGFHELLARMDAVMRRARPPGPSAKTVSHGSLRIDANLREVSVDGRPIEVTRKEFDLLWLLASHSGTVVPRRRLMRQVWGDTWSRRTVDTHVNSLRNKLGANTWIVTVRGVGFRLGEGDSFDQRASG